MVDASDVYLMMGKEHRISRNARASWYFNHLNTSISLLSVQRGKCKDVSTAVSFHAVLPYFFELRHPVPGPNFKGMPLLKK